MRPGKYDALNFEFDKQNLSLMLKEGRFDLWDTMEEQLRIFYKSLTENLLEWELEEHRNTMTNDIIYRNGRSSITLMTRLGSIEIKRPRLRNTSYESRILPKYTKNEEQLLELISNLYLLGISTRKMELGLRSILKEKISHTQVSTITNRIKPALDKFHSRQIEDKYVYLYFDGITMTLRPSQDEPSKTVVILVAYGVTNKGEKEIIDFIIRKSESETHWYGFTFNLYERGLKGSKLKLIITDGSSGLHNALDSTFPRTLRQRCWVHKVRNVRAYLRKKDEEECIEGLKAIYTASHRRAALKAFKAWKIKWETLYTKAINCIEKDLEELLNFFYFDESHRKKIRTTNPIERVFKEFRRRTNVMDNHLSTTLGLEKIFFVLTGFLNERWKNKKYLIFPEIEKMPFNLPAREAA